MDVVSMPRTVCDNTRVRSVDVAVRRIDSSICAA